MQEQMKLTITQGEKALQTGETPVGCVLVYDDKIVGSGMNDTNKSMNVGVPNETLLQMAKRNS